MFAQGFIMSTVIRASPSPCVGSDRQDPPHEPAQFRFDHTRDILSRVTNDIDTLSQNLNQGLMQILVAFVTMAGVLVMMLRISWLMTLVTFFILPISLFIISRIVKKSQKHFIQQQQSLGELNGQWRGLRGHVIIKAFGAENQMIATFEQTNGTLYESAWKSSSSQDS